MSETPAQELRHPITQAAFVRLHRLVLERNQKAAAAARANAALDYANRCVGECGGAVLDQAGIDSVSIIGVDDNDGAKYELLYIPTSEPQTPPSE